MKRTGLLLLNLGTPDAPTVPAVRRYLREFLSDPRVIDIPWLFRMMLLYLIVLPFRPKKSAAAYAEVWMPEGSPLLVYGLRLHRAVTEYMGPEWSVHFGMRYGGPGYEKALQALRDEGLDEVVILPLYPQWASSSTGSCQDAVEAWLASNGRPFEVKWIDNFYDQPEFIQAQVELCRQVSDWDDPSVHWLFSYHGLPERQVRNVHPGHCLTGKTCCDAVGPENARCYRAHCFGTSRALARGLGLREDQWTISFQSRLGRTPWLTPSTEDTLEALVQAGKTNVRVACPSFAADCLETLEEMDLRGDELFREAGGESFARASCVNDHPLFVKSVAILAERAR